MISPVTIVLPVHNGERTLRKLVANILELALAPKRALTIVVIDDGSTDDTYDAACELAQAYPQVIALRQPYHGGLGAGLAEVQQRLGIEQAIVHDGKSSVDLAQLAELLRSERPRRATQQPIAPIDGRGSRRFSEVSALHARMAEVHRSAASFQWLSLGRSEKGRRQAMPALALDSALPIGQVGATATLRPF